MAKKRVLRAWSDDEKRSICLQTFASGASVSQVAQRYSLSANQIFKWLRDERFAPSADEIGTAAFLPIEVCGEPKPLPSVLEPDTACRSHGRVEIALSNRHRVTIERDFDVDALARVSRAMDGYAGINH